MYRIFANKSLEYTKKAIRRGGSLREIIHSYVFIRYVKIITHKKA